jgi:putative glutamine amidotransferase
MPRELDRNGEDAVTANHDDCCTKEGSSMAKEAPRPVIGINADYFAATKTLTAHARVNAGYFDSIFNAGALPLIIPPIPREADIDAYLDRVDGVLLTGGLDMDPKRNNQPVTNVSQPMADRRDQSDRILIRRIIERKIPVMAIGVGMQQINVLLGGTLHNHLPIDIAKAMPHFDPQGGPHRHSVMLEPDTKIDEIYGGGELLVNSRHHQGINVLAKGLKVGALAPDGVIEAIEYEEMEDWFCLGLQWHPEADTASKLDQQLFECFIQAAVRGHVRKPQLANR